MSAFGKMLRKGQEERYSFYCPGCKQAHSVVAGPNGWSFNHDAEKPTFNPSVLVRTGHYASHYKPEDNCWCKFNQENPGLTPSFDCVVCHSFIRDGQIQFLGDCTHALAGQTVPIPEWPSDYQGG